MFTPDSVKYTVTRSRNAKPRKLELNGPIEQDLQESGCLMWRILGSG